MAKDKVKYLKDKKVEAVGNINFKNAVNKNAQNPIVSKFVAFKKTKDDVNLKDLF